MFHREWPARASLRSFSFIVMFPTVSYRQLRIAIRSCLYNKNFIFYAREIMKSRCRMPRVQKEPRSPGERTGEPLPHTEVRYYSEAQRIPPAPTLGPPRGSTGEADRKQGSSKADLSYSGPR